MALRNTAAGNNTVHSKIMEIRLSAKLFGAQQPIFINTNGNDLPHIWIKCGRCSYYIFGGTFTNVYVLLYSNFVIYMKLHKVCNIH